MGLTWPGTMVRSSRLGLTWAYVDWLAGCPQVKRPEPTFPGLLRAVRGELFYGYYLSAGIMMREDNGPAVPEPARRAALSSCRHDPVR
jgi:hypothetical protein